MYARFSLFNTACDLAHTLWKSLLKKGDCAIDATLGNGHDALFLAEILIKEGGSLWGFDIQEEALINTQSALKKAFKEEELKKVTLFKESHDRMEELVMSPVKLIVYNLGYLPGGDKGVTTKCATTLLSIEQGMRLLSSGGALSIICYPGHKEGEQEEILLKNAFSALDPRNWSVSHFQFINRKKSPSLFFIQKNINN